MFAVQQLSQFMHKPSSHDWSAALHVVCYLKGCQSRDLFYPSSNHLQLKAYCDVDWASCMILAGLSLVFACFLAQLSSPGRLRNSPPCPASPLRLNIEASPPLYVSFYGHRMCFATSAFHFPLPCLYGAITMPHCTSLRILSFTNGQSTWTSIVISFTINIKLVLCSLSMFALVFN